MRDETNVAGACHRRGEGGIQAGQRIHHAKAVGPDDSHFSTFCVFQNLPFQFRALRADFLKAGRNDDCAFDAGIDAFFDDAGYGWRGRNDDGKIDGLRHGGDIGICFDAKHAGAFGIHRKHRAAKWIADEIPQNRAPDAPGIFGCANHGNVLGRENYVERARLVVVYIVRGFKGWDDGAVHFKNLLFFFSVCFGSKSDGQKMTRVSIRCQKIDRSGGTSSATSRSIRLYSVWGILQNSNPIAHP